MGAEKFILPLMEAPVKTRVKERVKSLEKSWGGKLSQLPLARSKPKHKPFTIFNFQFSI